MKHSQKILGISSLCAVALLAFAGCCGQMQDTYVSKCKDAPTYEQASYQEPAPPPPPAPAPAPQTAQVSERAGVRVSMLPLSSPPYRGSEPPRTVFAETPDTYAYAPQPSGVCQVVPPGSTIFSEPPTVTVSSTGQVIDSTPATYRTTAPGYPADYGTVYAAAPVSAPVTVYESQSYSALPGGGYTQTTTTSFYSEPAIIAPAVLTEPTMTYPAATYGQPVVTETTYTVSEPLTFTPAVYNPDAPFGAGTASGGFAPAVPATTGGLMLVPATDIPPGIHPNDALPSQWFEVVRPGNGPLRIGRVSSTCVCVSVRVPKRHIEQGERALIEARIVSRPPANNLTYGIFVNTVEPVQQTLDSDITIRF